MTDLNWDRPTYKRKQKRYSSRSRGGYRGPAASEVKVSIDPSIKTNVTVV